MDKNTALVIIVLYFIGMALLIAYLLSIPNGNG